jgi:hypothetical protein
MPKKVRSDLLGGLEDNKLRKIFGMFCFGIAMVAVFNARNYSIVPPKTASAKTGKFVSSGWTEDEGMLSKAMSIRAANLEHKTRFKFDKDWTPKVSLEWSVGGDIGGFNGIYKPETQTTYFPIRILYDLTARHKQSAGSLDAETAAGDDELAELLDHELGHVLMDQVSRRNGLGPWFTEKRFGASTQGERIGLDILSEGTAVFFQNVYFPRDYRDLSVRTFPATREEDRLYTYRMIAYDGGYWMVREVLNKYGERGLIWFLQHPFLARDDTRPAAIVYRDRALKELSKE